MKEKTRSHGRGDDGSGWVGGRLVKRGFLDISVVCFIKLVFASRAHIRTNPSESTSSSLSVLLHTATILITSFLLPPLEKNERKPTKTSLSLCSPTAFPATRLVRPAPAGIRNVEEPLTQFSPYYLYCFKSLIVTIIFSLLRFALLIILRFCFPTVHTIHASFSDRYFSLSIFLGVFFF